MKMDDKIIVVCNYIWWNRKVTKSSTRVIMLCDFDLFMDRQRSTDLRARAPVTHSFRKNLIKIFGLIFVSMTQDNWRHHHHPLQVQQRLVALLTILPFSASARKSGFPCQMLRQPRGPGRGGSWKPTDWASRGSAQLTSHLGRCSKFAK